MPPMTCLVVWLSVWKKRLTSMSSRTFTSWGKVLIVCRCTFGNCWIIRALSTRSPMPDGRRSPVSGSRTYKAVPPVP